MSLLKPIADGPWKLLAAANQLQQRDQEITALRLRIHEAEDAGEKLLAALAGARQTIAALRSAGKTVTISEDETVAALRRENQMLLVACHRQEELLARYEGRKPQIRVMSR
jgi:septal ring factor EnvC (AmiA/AmiB activator)